MILAAFIFALSAIAIGAVLAYRHERALHQHYERESKLHEYRAAFYRDAYEATIYPRQRSAVSEAKEGYAQFATVDELTNSTTRRS